VAWGALGELCGKYLRKGRRVYVEERLVNREYEKVGEKRTMTEVVMEDMILLDAKPSEPTTAGVPTLRGGADFTDDTDQLANEIPF
jgi:single-strand DNA-binding protein